MNGVRRVVPLTLGWIDLPEYVMVHRGPATEMRARFHGDPVMRPVIPGAGEPLEESLDRAAVDIRDVRAVAVSHLHWDHAGGLRHFAGRVPVHIQRAEYDYGTQAGPEPEEHGMFRIDYDDPRIDWRFCSGDTELAPGVTAVLTSGHTPGHQSFAVELAEGGGYVFAFDAANLTHNCDHEIAVGGLINATPADSVAQIRKLKRIAAERGYQLIPGHDPVAWPRLTGTA